MKIVIGADLVSTATAEEYFKNGDVDFLFNDVKDVIRNADRTVVNLECALTTSENGRMEKRLARFLCFHDGSLRASREKHGSGR